jgi:hypothetical protein
MSHEYGGISIATYRGVTYDTAYLLPRAEGDIPFGPTTWGEPDEDFSKEIAILEEVNPGLTFEHVVDIDPVFYVQGDFIRPVVDTAPPA